MLSQCCYRCLQILHYLIQVNKSIVIQSLEYKNENENETNNNPKNNDLNFVGLIVRILTGVERNTIWFPVLLRASEIFQVNFSKYLSIYYSNIYFFLFLY